MAISLASGVLVSTVLTLIVIPLGCISASKDLLEVAAATAPEGVLLSQPETAAEDAGVPATEPQAETAQGDRRPSLPARIWGSVVGLVALVFYLIRGLFLLLFQRLDWLAKRHSSDKADALAPQAGGAGSGPSGAPPAPEQGGGQSDMSSSRAAQSAATTAAAVREGKTTAARSAAPEPVKVVDQAGVVEAKAEQQTQSDQAKASTKPAALQQAAKEQGVPKAKKRPSTLKKQAKKKTASPQAKSKAAPATTAKTKPSAGNDGEQAGGRRDEAAEKRKSDSKVAPFPVKKRSPRRGIRLK
jgi:hypothetical protein